MKKIILTLLSIGTFSYFSFAQNTFPSSGSVGIGTTSPSLKLTVVVTTGITPFDSKAGSVGDWQFGQNVGSGSGDDTFGFYSTTFGLTHSYAPILQMNSATGNILLAQNAGSVGIGTTSPSAKFHIVGNGGSLATLSSGVMAVVQNNLNTSDNALLNITGGSSAITGIQFGTSSNSSNGAVYYDQSLNTFRFYTSGSEKMRIDASGNVGINTTNTQGYTFAVNGTAIATSMTVKAYTNWPDYVFKKDYQLSPLTELKTYIDQNHHLPETPTEQQIAKDGLNLGETDKLLVKKVEELTLYLIESDKKNREQEKKIADQDQRIKALETKLDELLKKDH